MRTQGILLHLGAWECHTRGGCECGNRVKKKNERTCHELRDQERGPAPRIS
jgi:hypothetical protein